MTMSRRNPHDVFREGSGRRGIFLRSAALELALFLGIGVLWLVFLTPKLHVWWLFVPILPIHFSSATLRRATFRRATFTKKKVVCPACQAELEDFAGRDVAGGTCPRCGAPLR